jgi:Flp pilus assembly protein TadD
MKNHRYIWAIALAALLAAGALAWLRQDSAPESAVKPDIELQIANTLRLLEQDPQMEKPLTLSRLRQAAVSIENEKTNTAEAAYLLGLQHMREHNLPVAESLFRKATELRPEWNLPWFELGTLLGKHSFGRTTEAEKALRKAIEIDPLWARAHNSLAVLLRLKENFEEAEKEAKYALELAPDDVAAHNNYANLLISLGRFEKAEYHYQKALELDPDRPKPFYNLACLYAIMGNTATAMQHLETAITMEPMLREEAWNDPDLEAIRDFPEFQKLIYGEMAQSSLPM